MSQSAAAAAGTPKANDKDERTKVADPMTSNAGGSDGEAHDEDGDGDIKVGGKGGKSRRELPTGAVATLKAWLLSPEHFTHPYPTPQDQVLLMQKTGIDKKQLKNWFTNARRRIWKPMLKKQLEQGKLAATGAGGGGVAVPGVIPGLMGTPGVPGALPVAPQAAPPGDVASTTDNPHSVQAMHAHYQQAVQQQQQQQSPQTQQGFDVYGNPYPQQTQQQAQQQTQQTQPQQTQQPSHPAAPAAAGQSGQFAGSTYYSTANAPAPMAPSNSIGSLPPMGTASAPASAPANQATHSGQMNKTDSHAVLMELFARDQDLVRQATEGAKLKTGATTVNQQQTGTQAQGQVQSQHPMKMAAQQSRIGSVPSINSWPHFSSVSSLNNLGTMTGVKSITNMTGADVASQGNLNKKGNLAQVKSIESMGRADSFAFLEVFFDDKSGGSGGGGSGSSGQRGVKREREEDNDVGLSLDADADESPSSSSLKPNDVNSNSNVPVAGAPSPAPLPADGKDKEGTSDNGTLKRAYDDALAARGLLSVSRSSERLTDLALPAKMQRTLSQEYLRQHMQSATAASHTQQYGNLGYAGASGGQTQQQTSNSLLNQHGQAAYQQQPASTQQYPGQHPGQQQQQQGASQQFQASSQTTANNPTPLSDPSMASASVEVPATTKCSLCNHINVDTQLRPCGHMFHGRCLKPSLQNAMGPPKCPIDHVPMQSAVLAVPTDQNAPNKPQPQLSQQQQQTWGSTGSLPTFQSNIKAEASGGKA